MRPGDLPPAEHHAHGTRARYVTGCRCDPCRTANRTYARERAQAQREGDWNGLVDAEPARAHLLALSKKGVGYKSVAAASDVAATVLQEILSGAKAQIRARTARRVLDIDETALADAALVSARPTWKLVRALLEAGLTKGEIARRLGCERPALQIGRRRVLARTALAVQRLHAEVKRELQVERDIGTICPDCGFSHEPERRQALLARLLPCTAEDVREAYPCIYGGGPHSAGKALMYRDLRALRATSARGMWLAPELRSAA